MKEINLQQILNEVMYPNSYISPEGSLTDASKPKDGDLSDSVREKVNSVAKVTITELSQ